jgi:tetratricopeptide (TPR) repeat protein
MRSAAVRKQQLLVFFVFTVVVAVTTGFAYQLINHEWVYFRRAEDRFREKKFPPAITLYNRAMEAGLDDERIIEHLADSLMATGQFEQSLFLYEELPGDPHIVEKVGALYDHFGRVNDALLLYELYNRGHLRPRSLLHLADLRERKGHFKGAEKIYRHLLMMGVVERESRYRLARLFFYTQRFSASLEQIRLILYHEPTDWSARVLRAQVLLAQKRKGASLDELGKIPLHQVPISLYLDLADLCMAHSLFDDGDFLLSRFLRKFPDDAIARLRYAELLTWKKRYSSSLTEYERLLHRYPQSRRIRAKYAVVLSWLGRSQDSLEQLRIAKYLAPENMTEESP